MTSTDAIKEGLRQHLARHNGNADQVTACVLDNARRLEALGLSAATGFDVAGTTQLTITLLAELVVAGEAWCHNSEELDAVHVKQRLHQSQARLSATSN